ncbi:hypothetical protein [Burkholderia vietnamiensis]|uniref:hypothetical protein n=2 Tax=Burkholderiaceae TaxID=119060 RepID=UPI000D7870B2|nr:hypothetical protein [Burkholderia vietnamiensis]GBH25737.1 hypothetical protein BvRS1_27860 [Burkholderia vietnamiensis]
MPHLISLGAGIAAGPPYYLARVPSLAPSSLPPAGPLDIVIVAGEPALPLMAAPMRAPQSTKEGASCQLASSRQAARARPITWPART